MSQEDASAVTHFHLTGFGEFCGVKDNPTEQLMKSLPEYLRQHPLPSSVCLDSLTVVETSGVGSRESLQQLAHCEQSGKDGKSTRRVYLHFGVDSGSSTFCLESTAYNVADFRVPDQRQWQPRNEQILAQCPSEYCTALDVDSLCAELIAARRSCESDDRWRCVVSTDPGRFVCNFIYYNSLHRSKEEGAVSLFVHVPSHEVYDLAAQQEFARAVILAIARSFDHPSGVTAQSTSISPGQAAIATAVQ